MLFSWKSHKLKSKGTCFGVQVGSVRGLLRNSECIYSALGPIASILVPTSLLGNAVIMPFHRRTK